MDENYGLVDELLAVELVVYADYSAEEGEVGDVAAEEFAGVFVFEAVTAADLP